MSVTVVVTGGGSGGHITPILAVAAELKRLRPETKVVYIGQRGDSLGDIPANDPNIDETYTVFAGKFRRYHGEGFRQLLDIPTMLKNIRDILYVGIGLVQSWRLMKKIRPDVVFSRGGFVSVPVALGAALRRVPYITHDSDPIPSLANRIIAPWARLHAVALPADIYPYPAAKTVTTGIPLSKDFVPVTPALKEKYRAELQISPTAQLLFVIGGGLGSQRVNRAVAEALPHLLHDFQKLEVVQAVGRANVAEMEQYYSDKLPPGEQGRVKVVGFIPDVYRYSGAADIVITRAGATNLAEFALQGKACIVIPSPFLAAGHQLKNSQYLVEQGAALVINESDLAADPNRLAKQIAHLLHNPDQLTGLAAKLATFARPKATGDLAKLILEQAHETTKTTP
jgi:UDP-N-acetylglucosamine--N-acetylmuramyl-(pentapeptide) pyrophosphoryl-undecaprenol N-acetylglucosamine transferase